MFDSNKLKGELTKAQEQIKSLEASNKELQVQVETATKSLTEANDKANAHADAIKKYDDAALNMKAEFDAKISELTKEVEAAKVSANKEAVNLVASLGVDVGTIKETISSDLTPSAIRSKFEGMLPGQERTEFYKKHKAVLQANGFKQ